MDLDGDGNDDVISGSYWPGDMFWFRGLGGAKYAKGEKLRGADGKDLNAGGTWKGEQQPDMDSLATAPFAADLDGDGDLDLVVGNIAGHVIFIRNDGTPKEPKFGAKSRIQADGSDLQVPNGDTGPTLVDWDGDGDLDLVVGAGNGSVWLHTNRGTKSNPDFAKGEQLVAAMPFDDTRKPGQGPSEPTGPGSRAKVCVTDWNGDGRLDLLVGDFNPCERSESSLTPEQKKRRDELIKLQQSADQELAELRNDGVSAGNHEYVAKFTESRRIDSDLRKLIGGDYHGWVWLFLRKAKGVSGG